MGRLVDRDWDRYKALGNRIVRAGSSRASALLATGHEKRVAQWFQMEGEDLRLDYPLDRASVVLDVGGFKGQWASDIFAKYLCTVHVYEPIPEFAEYIARRFAKNDSIVVHAEGLGATTRTETALLQSDATTMTSGPGNSAPGVPVQVRAATEAIDALDIDRIDLLKLNIEGMEFELLESLLDHDYVRRIDHLQIQFHDFFEDAHQRRDAIQQRLRATHELDYCVPFVWESWHVHPLVRSST
jgi:FkbM family methyltransferase